MRTRCSATKIKHPHHSALHVDERELHRSSRRDFKTHGDVTALEYSTEGMHHHDIANASTRCFFNIDFYLGNSAPERIGIEKHTHSVRDDIRSVRSFFVFQRIEQDLTCRIQLKHLFRRRIHHEGVFKQFGADILRKRLFAIEKFPI